MAMSSGPSCDRRSDVPFLGSQTGSLLLCHRWLLLNTSEPL